MVVNDSVGRYEIHELVTYLNGPKKKKGVEEYKYDSSNVRSLSDAFSY